MLQSLSAIDFAKLTDAQKLDLIRTYEVLFNRFGQPTADEAHGLAREISPGLPERQSVRGWRTPASIRLSPGMKRLRRRR